MVEVLPGSVLQVWEVLQGASPGLGLLQEASGSAWPAAFVLVKADALGRGGGGWQRAVQAWGGRARLLGCPGSYALVCGSKAGTGLGRLVPMTPVWEQLGHLDWTPRRNWAFTGGVKEDSFCWGGVPRRRFHFQNPSLTSQGLTGGLWKFLGPSSQIAAPIFLFPDPGNQAQASWQPLSRQG